MTASLDRPPDTSPPSRRDTMTEALLLWLSSRLGIVVLAVVGVTAMADGDTIAPFLERWRHWDADLLITIAEHGYGGDPSGEPDKGLRPSSPGCP
ncbi:hypothetical protein ACFQX6_42740 [Streptosporangium lutulentum]